MQGLDGGRINIAASSLGGAYASLKLARVLPSPLPSSLKLLFAPPSIILFYRRTM